MRHALFPLSTVLFPGSILPLQIFEQRYLSLIKECMKAGTGFVIVLIDEGKEVGDTPSIYRVGCYVEIIDWDNLPNGLLGISIKAKHRVKLGASSVRDDGLMMAETSILQKSIDTQKIELPEGFKPLAETLKQLLQHPFAERYRNKVDFNCSADICYRLAELLPIELKQKQLLLESETSQELLDHIAIHINSLQN